jgi:hypothetical protein
MIEITKEQLEAMIYAVGDYEELIDSEWGFCRSIDEIHKADDARDVYQMLLDIRSKEEAKQKAEQIADTALNLVKHLAQKKTI